MVDFGLRRVQISRKGVSKKTRIRWNQSIIKDKLRWQIHKALSKPDLRGLKKLSRQGLSAELGPCRSGQIQHECGEIRSCATAEVGDHFAGESGFTVISFPVVG